MKTAKPIWICSECGEDTTSWAGRCPNCGAWNTLREVRLPSTGAKSGRSGQTAARRERPIIVDLAQSTTEQALPGRLTTNYHEVDRVLGGGFFPGTVALLAGEPGIGKSTLLLAVAHHLAGRTSVLYCSGEESVDQIRHRADRLGFLPSAIKLMTSTDLEILLETLSEQQPQFVILDSIQTIVDQRYPSAAGSTVQVRECALALQRWAKEQGSTLLLVGHVTKEGTVAGPRTLEHLVDVLLTLEGERTTDLRLLRSPKNRFGPTDEVGILAMGADGLQEVSQPSLHFLPTDLDEPVPGSVLTVTLEGRRPIVLDVQALTRRSVTTYPRRTASGIDTGRLELILAILEARAGILLHQTDCFVNVSGGFRLREPAADLAVALAIVSAVNQRPLPRALVAFGELGLAGDIRPIPLLERRREEAQRLGFTPLDNHRTVRAALMSLKLID
ncbi:DNA repair protein RadA [Candidatus Berkelbacteria bacterium]|nr:DNA repair protein RadA [Candidatus Berkelbacteria bacterium]